MESVKLARLYLEFNDWDAVRNEVLSKNLLQSRTLNSSKRICREIMSRLRTLDAREIEFLVHSSPQEQGYLLWLAICRRYEFIADFAIEVVRERYISLKNDLHHEDFDSFFNSKSQWHPELDEIQPTSKKKLRQVLFRILREAELLTPKNTIYAAMLSPRLLNVIPHQSRQDVLVFPIFESDLEEWVQ